MYWQHPEITWCPHSRRILFYYILYDLHRIAVLAGQMEWEHGVGGVLVVEGVPSGHPNSPYEGRWSKELEGDVEKEVSVPNISGAAIETLESGVPVFRINVVQ